MIMMMIVWNWSTIEFWSLIATLSFDQFKIIIITSYSFDNDNNNDGDGGGGGEGVGNDRNDDDHRFLEMVL